MEHWTRNPAVLFESFDTTPKGPPGSVENANATARFIVLWTVAATAIASLITIAGAAMQKTAPRFFYYFLIVGAVMLLASGVSTHDATVPADTGVQEMKYCQTPTVQNPMANPLITDYGTDAKLPACPSDAVTPNIDAAIKRLPISSVISSATNDDYAQEMGQRSFYSMPVTTVPQNVENFRNALYGESINRRVDHGFDTNIFSA